MVIVKFTPPYLSDENCKAGDIGTFIGEGEMQPREYKGKKWEQFVIPIEINEFQITHSPKSAEGKRLQDAYGEDTKLWIGKQFKTVFLPYVDGKDVKYKVEIIPLEQKA